MDDTASQPDADTLQIHEDMRFQQRTWIMQRIGWALMALVLLAALLGLFSKGPLSIIEQQDATGTLRVSYERFMRFEAPSSLRIDIAPQALTGPQVEVQLSGQWLDDFKIEDSHPPALETRLVAGGYVMAFPASVSDPKLGSSIHLSIKPQSLGTAQGEIGLAGASPIHIQAFVYP